MQKFLFVNTKGFSLEQAIIAMHANLEKVHAEPETALLEIHSVNFVNTFEKPQKSSLDLNGNNQPVIVYNCCVVLVEPAHSTRMEQLVSKLSNQLSDMISLYLDEAVDSGSDLPGPSEKEIEDLKKGAAFIKRSAQFTCEHKHLDPVKHSKAYKNAGQYFQFCQDCGAEVWNEPGEGYIPGPGIGGTEWDGTIPITK